MGRSPSMHLTFVYVVQHMLHHIGSKHHSVFRLQCPQYVPQSPRDTKVHRAINFLFPSCHSDIGSSPGRYNLTISPKRPAGSHVILQSYRCEFDRSADSSSFDVAYRNLSLSAVDSPPLQGFRPAEKWGRGTVLLRGGQQAVRLHEGDFGQVRLRPHSLQGEEGKL